MLLSLKLIRKHFSYFILLLLILLVLSYFSLGLKITVFLNVIFVLFSLLIIEDNKKSIALFLLGTVLWGAIPIIQYFDQEEVIQNNSSFSEDEINYMSDRIVEQLSIKFGNSPINLTLETDCISNITTFDYKGFDFNYSAYLFDGCDVHILPTVEGPLPETTLMAYLVYPFWNNNSDVHYFFDVYSDNLRENRFSLFVDENRYLIGKFFDSKGTAYEVPVDVSDWKDQEWALIIFQSNELDQEISVTYINIPQNSLKLNFVKVTNYSVDFSSATMYAGSDIFGKNQADAVVGNVPPWWIFSDDDGYNPSQRNSLS